jgi:excinuclease ABC subunit C
LLYVGKSKSLRHRLLSYFDKSPSEPKIERLRKLSSRIVWEPVSHDLLALLREQELIFRWRPTFNRQGQPERRKPGFACVGGGVAPRAYLTLEPCSEAVYCVGPLIGRTELRRAIETLNYVYGLRDCPDRTRIHLTNQLPLFADSAHAQCIRHELGTCLGPCSGACSSGRYRQAVAEAIAFLRGTDRSIIERLRDEMDQAAARLAFERARVLCDQWKSLAWLARRLEQRSRQRRELHGAFRVPSFDRSPCYLVLDEGYVQGMERKVSARTREGSLGRIGSSSAALDTEWMLIVAGWFQKRSAERERIRPIGMADVRASA